MPYFTICQTVRIEISITEGGYLFIESNLKEYFGVIQMWFEIFIIIMLMVILKELYFISGYIQEKLNDK